LIPGLPNTAHSCDQHGPVTAWFKSARQGNVIPVPKTFTLLSVVVHYRNGVASVKVKFCVLLKSPFVKKIELLRKNCRVLRGYEIMFLKRKENFWRFVRCVTPLTSLPLHPAVEEPKLSDENNKMFF
jgi:hypothetical protein